MRLKRRNMCGKSRKRSENLQNEITSTTRESGIVGGWTGVIGLKQFSAQGEGRSFGDINLQSYIVRRLHHPRWQIHLPSVRGLAIAIYRSWYGSGFDPYPLYETAARAPSLYEATGKCIV
ncbi:hypothetical protein AAG570_010851 [Ranatra chinensis]|uniref:Uncharacterized protein n=1 Tax=Ranatra chinensis TaxID=642074 RepID=A0ABD0Z153_9HEMI